VLAHSPSTFALSAIALAVTAPLVAALPWTAAHSPTLTEVLVVEAVRV
jgi:hypothetical protein